MSSNKTFLLILVITVVLFIGCNFDDKYADTCIGKYSVERFKDSITKRYKITNQNIEFLQIRKIPINREYRCDTIYLEISTDSIPIQYSDTLALSLAKIFFGDTLNKNVIALDLALNGYWSIKSKINEGWSDDRRSFAKYRINRDSIEQYDLSNELIELDSMRYDIETERPLSSQVGTRTNEGLYLTVKIKKDYKNFTLLAEQIKDKYRSMIDEKRISSFLIKMIVDSVSSRLCTSKSYEFTYHIMEYLNR